MKTYRITEKDIQGMKPVAVGYKMFNHDFTTKHGSYNYKNENGNVVGTIHKVEGDIEECQWGLHFSRKPQDCFNFYECVQWNRFAKVEAYDQLIEGDSKCVTNILKIVQTYSFGEFIRLIQEDLQNGSNGVNRSNGVNWSDGVNRSYGVNWSDGVNGSYGIVKCEGISRSIFCYAVSGKLMAFNKPIIEERFNELIEKIKDFRWSPNFNNAEQLKGNLAWYETNIPAIVAVDNATAWSFMPAEMKAYIESLPEYDEEIFKLVTGVVEE